jgi:hypothetical protein
MTGPVAIIVRGIRLVFPLEGAQAIIYRFENYPVFQRG